MCGWSWTATTTKLPPPVFSSKCSANSKQSRRLQYHISALAFLIYPLITTSCFKYAHHLHSRRILCWPDCWWWWHFWQNGLSAFELAQWMLWRVSSKLCWQSGNVSQLWGDVPDLIRVRTNEIDSCTEDKNISKVRIFGPCLLPSNGCKSLPTTLHSSISITWNHASGAYDMWERTMHQINPIRSLEQHRHYIQH